MAECILLRASGGGIDPDELTATPEDVIRGKTFGGYGSDEMQRGILAERPGSSVASKITAGATKLIFQMLPGAYRKAITDGYCEVYADYATIRPLVGYYNQNHVLEGDIILGAEGKMKNFSNQTIPRDGNTGNVVGIENFFETASGKGSDIVIHVPNTGFFGNTKIVQAVYGVHPDIIQFGAVIGANPSHETGFSMTGNFTGDANADASDITYGKIAYVKGRRIVGSADTLVHEKRQIWTMDISPEITNDSWYILGSFTPIPENCSAALYSVWCGTNLINNSYYFAHNRENRLKVLLRINTTDMDAGLFSFTGEIPIEFSNNRTIDIGNISGLIIIKLEHLSDGKVYVYAKIQKTSNVAKLKLNAQALTVTQESYFK